MIRTTLASTECFLVTEDPNWTDKVSGEFNVLSATTESSTRRQERISLSSTVRTLLKWKSCMDYTEAPAFRSSLHSLGLDSSGDPAPLQPILCPFWPAMVSYGTASPYSAYYSVIFEPGFATWAIYVTTAGIGAYTVTAATMVAPLLWGVFDKLPVVPAITDEDVQIEFAFQDDGAAALALQVAATVSTGPGWQGAPSWPIFPEIPQYASVEAGGVDIIIERKQVGYTRDQQQSVYPQTPQRTIKAAFVLPDPSILLSLWLISGGDVRPFWMPAGFSPCRLAADVSGATVTLDNAAALDGQAHLFLNGATWAAQRIIGEVGNVLTLQAAPVGAFPMGTTYVQPLLFVHFKSATLQINWIDPKIATATLQVVELPPEYGAPAGETFGTTYGPVGAKSFLYTFTDSISTWYYTSNEADIPYGGNTYSSKKISHGTITERLNLADSSTIVSLRYFSGNPFTRFRQPRMSMAMFATIVEITAGVPVYLVDQNGKFLVDQNGYYLISGYTAVGAVTIFTGRVKMPKFSDTMIDVEIGGPTSIFDNMIPRPLVQLQCNNTFCDSKCTLVLSQWTFSATMPTPPGARGAPFQYTVDAISWPQGALPALGAHYFAFGYIVRTLTDGTKQGFLILDSAAISGGAIVLTLSGDLDPFPTGSEPWSIVPNCAGRYNEDCITTFNNKANFSGFPFMPLTDPSIFPQTPLTPAGSKK